MVCNNCKEDMFFIRIDGSQVIAECVSCGDEYSLNTIVRFNKVVIQDSKSE